MAVNKVVYGGNTIVDISDSTVSASDMAEVLLRMRQMEKRLLEMYMWSLQTIPLKMVKQCIRQ